MHISSTTTTLRPQWLRRVVLGLAAIAVTLGVSAAPAAAFTDEPHAHAKLLHFQEGPDGLSWQKCVDLAGGNALRNNSTHHETVHTGRAGEALRSAGHLVVPYSCADFRALLEQFGVPFTEGR